MDWEELRVRVAQEVRKHGDLLKYRLGVRNWAPALDSNLAGGQFFFSRDESRARADLIRQHLPEQTTAILTEADEICRHRFRMLGYENLRYGNASSISADSSEESSNEIDWHFDPVHGKRAPLDPWFKIPFLDFTVVGDHKVTWELNRHQHLVTLAKARLLSADADIANKCERELIAQWHSWIKANPYPLGINWGSSLEVAFRSLSWMWVDHLLPASAQPQPHIDRFRSQLLPALAFHGRYMERYLSTYFSPNTHLLGEAVALFFLGTLYPQMPGASRWKESGWKIVLHEAGRQVRPDGVYFEQSLHYHVYALDFFLYARMLAARNGISVPRSYDDVLSRMLDVVDALAQAGPAEGFGDDDGGRLFNPRRNRTEYATDPLALGELVYARNFPAAKLTEEAIWLFGNAAVDKRARDKANTSPQPAQSVAFRDGGIYALADSQPYARAITVDAGPQGVGRSGHGHADALSIRLTMNGRRWLVDSGSGVYISANPAERNRFRGTAAHNTLAVDGLDQALADEPFSWTNIPTTIAENWVAGKTFTYFVGSHDGYQRLADPVLHRRHVMQIAGGAFLVRDCALGHSEHELDIRWHFAPDLSAKVVAPGQIEVFPSGGAPDQPHLTLLVPEETVWSSATEAVQSRVSSAYGAVEPAIVVRSHVRISLPAETATAFIARVASDQKATASRFSTSTQPNVQAYELISRDETQGFLFATGGEAWSFGHWSSDAQVLYYRFEKTRLVHLVVIGGTYLAWRGETVLTAVTSNGFFEWRRSDALVNTGNGGFTMTPSFENLADSADPLSAGAGSALPDSSATYAEKH
jgi:Heparinase II/III-like protein/Heparinase II/III N-terminus